MNNFELSSQVGIIQAREILKDSLPDDYGKTRSIWENIEIDEGNRTWYSAELGQFGGIVEMFTIATEAPEEKWVHHLPAIIASLSEQDQAEQKPEAARVETKDFPFPIDAMPLVSREMCLWLARTQDVPVHLHAAAVIGTVGACLGKKIKLPTIQNLSVYGNNYVFIGAPSGFGKSIGLGPVFQPVNDFDFELRQAWEEKSVAANAKLREVEQQIAEAEKKEMEASEKAEALRSLGAQRYELKKHLYAPQVLIEDVTPEQMAVSMSRNGEVSASLSPDARAAFANLQGGRYTKGRSAQVDVLLKAWSGDPLRQDRIGRDEVNLREPILTLVLATQRDVFDRLYSTPELMTSGLLQRVLPCFVDHCGDNPLLDEVVAAPEADRYQAHLRRLLAAYHQHAGEPYTVRCDPQSHGLLANYQAETRRRANSGDLKHIDSFALRWGEHAWRVALVLHVLEHGDQSHSCTLSKGTATSALRIMWWFARHQRELVESALVSTENERLDIAKAFVDSKRQGVTARELYRHAQNTFGSQRGALKALLHLLDEGEIDRIEGSRANRFVRLPIAGQMRSVH